MPAPVAAFSGSPLAGTAPLGVGFADASTNTPTSWSWSFGDGGTSTSQNPSHTYSSAGLYSVSLAATNVSGTGSINKVAYVNVSQVGYDPLQGTPDQFLAADWKELVNNQSPSTITGSVYDADAVITGIIDYSKLFGAIRYVLGYQTATNLSPFQLLRATPVVHPKYQNLVCTSFDAQPIVADASQLKTTVTPPPTGGYIRAFANYKKVLFTAKFKPLQFAFGSNPDPDEDSADEWERFTITQAPKASLNILSSQGFQMKFIEGPLAGNKQATFPAPFGQLEPKLDYTFTWLRVPRNYLFDANGVPTKLWAGLGTVNDLSWNGFPKNTLLCNSITIAQYAWPWPAGTESDFIYDIGFEMQFFDPPNGATSAYGWGGTASTLRGWNLRPSPAVPGTIPANLKFPYYYAVRVKMDNTPSDSPLLGQTNFDAMWEHVLA